jgi:DNA ligase-1
MKLFPNKYSQALLSGLPPGLDGEVGIIKEDGTVDFRASTSALMSFDGEPDIAFFLFDNYLHPGLYIDRYASLKGFALPNWVSILEQRVILNSSEARLMFREGLNKKHEGLVLRKSDAPYKFGRSTLAEGYLYKAKPFVDSESWIIDILPQYENTNELKRDERGLAKRSTAKAGKVMRERMGKVVCKDPRWPETFEIGTFRGWTNEDREKFWQDRALYIDKAYMKYLMLDVGNYDVPRSAIGLSVRMKEDV